jgi:hypothetical protein
VLHRDVAVFVGGRAAQQCNVDMERLVPQPFPAVDLDQLDEIFARGRALPAAAVPRIDERMGPVCVTSPAGRPPARA